MSKRIFLYGPFNTLTDTDYMAGLAGVLERSGCNVYMPNPQQGSGGADLFAANVSEVVEQSDCLVFNLNGRVPDEGGVFLAGLAYAAGKPVALFKNDGRAPFGGRENSMILGLAPSFSTVNKMDALPRAVNAAIAKITALGENPYNGGLLERIKGSKVVPGVDSNDAVRKKIYCSGPLFCPEEKDEMGRIANALEGAGFDTYLPHRDGVEALAMGAAGSPLIHLPIVSMVTRRVEMAIFNVDIYELLECCDAIIVNLNGRTPDEGAVVEAAVAAASGVPVVFYHSAGPAGIINPTLKAATQIFPLIDTIEKITPAIQKTLTNKPAPTDNPPFVRRAIESGKKASGLLNKIISGKKPV